MKQHHATIWVCHDCYFEYHSGEEQPDSHCEPWNAIGDDVEITGGIMWEDHWSECPNRLAEEWVEECECEHDDFRTSSCDACGCHLAGFRGGMTMWWDDEAA